MLHYVQHDTGTWFYVPYPYYLWPTVFGGTREPPHTLSGPFRL